MLGFSIQKLLLLAAIVAAVWYGFKFIQRRQEVANAGDRLDRGGKPGGVRGPAADAKPAEAKAAEDMVQCPTCQAFVPARSAAACGRADCPY